MKNYLEQKLIYKNNKLINEDGRAVMMDWENEWMYESAKIICANGGNILNIGFGMGIIDSYIQSYNIETHTIIEAHPDVYDKMIKDGWGNKKNVKIIFSKWQDVIDNLDTYDGIYFDTWDDYGFYDILLPKLKKLLKENGVFSYWEGFSNKFINTHTTDLLYKDFEFDYKKLHLKNVPSKKEQFENEDGYYWNEKWDECLIPIIKHRKTLISKNLI